jgi:hypothetical protein
VSITAEEFVASVEILFETDTAIALAGDELSPETAIGVPVNFAMRSDETCIVEYVSSNLYREVKEVERLRRSVIWRLDLERCFASLGHEIPVDAKLNFEKHARKMAQRLKHCSCLFSAFSLADEVEPELFGTRMS